MALTINTNIMSLNAQRNLTTSQTKLSSAIERLSSGMRINSAKDDAAGMAISTRMTTQINGLTQAQRNANDGISLAQTTESALDEVTNNLQRIRELAVQSTNASNSASDRAALDAEVQQRLSEVTRIATQTNFNGMKVLDGSSQNLSFQVGANVGEVINVNLNQGMKATQIGGTAGQSVDLSTSFTTGGAGGAATAGSVEAAGMPALTATSAFDVDGTTVTLAGNYADADALAADVQSQLGASYAVTNDGGKLKIATAATGAAATAPVITNDADGVFTGSTPVAGQDAGAGTGTASSLTIAAGAAGLNFTVGGSTFSLAGTYKDTQSVADAINAHSSTGISAYVGTDGKLNIASTAGYTVDGTQAATLGVTSQATTSGSLDGSSVSTADAANATIVRIDAALQSVSNLRSDLGAVQNRFDSTISNLSNISQNLTSSKSAITDADFAQETANMSSAQILQQAGVSVLAQANQSQQIVTKLLQ